MRWNDELINIVAIRRQSGTTIAPNITCMSDNMSHVKMLDVMVILMSKVKDGSHLDCAISWLPASLATMKQ